MLPQMMPLPWLMVFFLIFFSLYSVFLYTSSFSFSFTPTKKVVNSSMPSICW